MELLLRIFGEGKDLNTLQMTCRGIAIFIVTLILIRVSGRRSFGMRSPLDNIIAILLGAILSRAVVGASPFVPTIVCGFAIVTLHRTISWLQVKSPSFSKFIQGEKIILFNDGTLLTDNLEKALLCEEDVHQGVRKSALTDDFNKIDKIFIERNGEISTLKKSV